VTLSKTRALYREILDFDADGGITMRQQILFHRILEFAAEDGGHLARHAKMAPQIRPVRDGLVIDFDDAIGGASGDRFTHGRIQLHDSGVVAVDAELGGRRQHPVALDALDGLSADRRVGRHQARPAVGRAADDGSTAQGTSVDRRRDKMRAGNRLDGFDARGAGPIEQLGGDLDALALRGLHGDEALERSGSAIQAVHQFANPVVGELQG